MEKLSKRNLLDVASLSREEVELILKKTDEIKSLETHEQLSILEGKTLVMLFEKPSTRTRISFEVGMDQLGGHALWFSAKDSHLGRGETVSDTAKVLSRYNDGIAARLFKHYDLEELARDSDIPVINALTDLHHPCQALADAYTIKQHLGNLKHHKVAFIGDGGANTSHSLMEACAKLGMDYSVASPEGYAPKPDVYKRALRDANENNSVIRIVKDPASAVEGADIVYTDTWVSMGFEEEAVKRVRLFKDYQVTRQLMQHAESWAKFMHCLPAHRGQEVSPEVIDGPQSIVFDQAENRLHVQKAVLSLLLA